MTSSLAKLLNKASLGPLDNTDEDPDRYSKRTYMSNKQHHTKYNQEVFSWPEVFADSVTGKSSATAVSGIACIGIGLLGFVGGVASAFVKHAEYTIELIYQSLALITIGAALLGIRRLSVTRQGVFSGADDDQIDTAKPASSEQEESKKGTTTTKKTTAKLSEEDLAVD